VDGCTDGRTYWRTDISPSSVIRSTRRSRPNKIELNIFYQTYTTQAAKSFHHHALPSVGQPWNGPHLLLQAICNVRRMDHWGWCSSFSVFVPGDLDLWPWHSESSKQASRLPCEFGTNVFSGSGDIWGTNKQKKSQTALKTEPYLCAIIITEKCINSYSKVAFSGMRWKWIDMLWLMNR